MKISLPRAAALAVAAALAAPARAEPWAEWQSIIYQPQSAARLAALRQIGVTAAMVPANRDDAAPAVPVPGLAPVLAEHLGFYVENIATDFYSAYHRWQAGQKVNAAFLAAQARYRENPQDMAAFIRDPGLTDPLWLERIERRLRRTVRLYARYRPLYYDLADEPGIGDLAAAWDFDFSPASLAGMRVWLRGQYGSLAALDREQGTHFSTWDSVRPLTTDEALRRQDGNFAAWADFKAWMDVAFTRAVRAGTDAVHEADPHALAAIEGAQIPGWGGYDYTLLSHAVDVMEIYDFGENVDIARDLNPSLVLLMTIAGGDAAQIRALWHGVLHGMRGVVLWDENGALLDADGRPGAFGRAVAPVLQELRDGLGAFLIGSARETGPVAILYSSASFRTQWLLDRQREGGAWAARDAEAEYGDNALRTATAKFAAALRRRGLQPLFIAPQGLAGDALHAGGIRVLMLPHSLALSAEEATAIRRFVAAGGAVVADIVPGAFDQHSRRRTQPVLADLFAAPMAGHGTALLLPADVADTGLDALFDRQGITPYARLTMPAGAPAGDVESVTFRRGATRILALQSSLAAPDAAPRQMRLSLKRPVFVYDVRARRALGRTDHLTFMLDPVAPSILAFAPNPLPAPPLAAPPRSR